MLLGVFDRVILLNILPGQGDITSVRIVHQLRQSLSFTEAEHAALDFQTGEDGSVRWKAEADTPVEVEIGPRAHTIISDTLKRLSDQRQLTEEHLALYERFVEAP